MKVLISAYACEPGKGSEPEVGLRTLLAAATEHDVWVITRRNNVEPLRGHLASDPNAAHVKVIGFDVAGPVLRHKKRHGAIGQLYYDRWQHAVAFRAVELDRKVGFDVVHHATFAAYWKRTGVAAVDRPLVWGPVGGGVGAPRSLWTVLGARGIAEEVARNVVRPVVAKVPSIAAPQRRSAVTLTQNVETAGRLAGRHAPVIVPNALAVRVPDSILPTRRQRTVVTVARLVAWKGVSLAVRAFAALNTPDVLMTIVGDGPELSRLQQLASDLRLDGQVTFAGRLPREQTLRTIASAGVLVHPALHEEAGLVVSEALSYGTPVVCLDRGGPPELLTRWPHVPSWAIQPGSRSATVKAVASALDRALRHSTPATAVHAPTRSYEQMVLDAYDLAIRRGRP